MPEAHYVQDRVHLVNGRWEPKAPGDKAAEILCAERNAGQTSPRSQTHPKDWRQGPTPQRASHSTKPPETP